MQVDYLTRRLTALVPNVVILLRSASNEAASILANVITLMSLRARFVAAPASAGMPFNGQTQLTYSGLICEAG